MRSRPLVVGLVVGLSLVVTTSAAAYHTRFVADNCNYAAPTPTWFITRDGSAAVALRARYEGYQWAGRCFVYTPMREEQVLRRAAASSRAHRKHPSAPSQARRRRTG